MNDKNVTKIAVRIFHSAEIYIIYTVSAHYLHGHEHTKYTESVLTKPKRLIICLTVCTNHHYKDEKEDESHTKINNRL